MAHEKNVKNLERGDIVLYIGVLFRVRFVAHNTADLWNRQEQISAVPISRLSYVGRDTLTVFADSPTSVWSGARRDHRVIPIYEDDSVFGESWTDVPTTSARSERVALAPPKPKQVDEISTADLIRKEVRKLKTTDRTEEDNPVEPSVTIPKREGKW